VLRPRQHCSALLAALCIVASLGMSGLERTLHFAFVPHGWCEHGETVDEADDQRDAAEDATSLSARRLDLTAAQQGSRHGDGHEHCSWVAVQPATVPVVQRAVASTLLDWQLLAMATAPTEECSPIALLLLAPKSSPPLVA
jgi:hypothetical protein